MNLAGAVLWRSVSKGSRFRSVGRDAKHDEMIRSIDTKYLDEMIGPEGDQAEGVHCGAGGAATGRGDAALPAHVGGRRDLAKLQLAGVPVLTSYLFH